MDDPFEGYKVYGPYLSKKERRRVIILVSENRRTSISYARYTMCVHLGRLLTNEEEVDHKDNDKLNDVLENLQILTKGENVSKSNKLRKKELKHGTLSKVKHCKPICEACRSVKREYMREYMRKRRAKKKA